MSSKKGFTSGFHKSAGILGSGAKLVGKGILGAGKLVSRVAGGPVGAALTGLGALSDYGDISSKMRQAAQR